jgi:hypothetical protein
MLVLLLSRYESVPNKQVTLLVDYDILGSNSAIHGLFYAEIVFEDTEDAYFRS